MKRQQKTTAFVFQAMVTATLVVGRAAPAVAQTGVSSSPQFANGVAHSEQYPGSSLDVRVNACLNDAMLGANGATSHICSSEGESATNQILAPIIVGAPIAVGVGPPTPVTPVTWILPASCNWQVVSSSSFTGTQAAIEQFSYTNIFGRAGHYGCTITNATSSLSLSAVYESSIASFIRASNFTISNLVSATTSGAAFLLVQTDDASSLHDIEVSQYVPNGIGVQIGGMGKPCCATSLTRFTVNNGYKGGPVVSIIGNSHGAPNGVIIADSSLEHPGSGQPVISCSGASNFNVTVFLDNIYEEGGLADESTPLNQDNGCRGIHVNGMEVKVEGTTTSTAPAWQIVSSSSSSLDIQGLSMELGFIDPAIAVQDDGKVYCSTPPCNIMTDAHGYLSSYGNGVKVADQINISGGYKVNGAALSISSLTGTVLLPGQLPYATSSTIGAMRGDGTSVYCTAGICTSLAGGAGTVTGTGSPSSISAWTSAMSEKTSALSDNGTTVASSEPIAITGTLTPTEIVAPSIVLTNVGKNDCLQTSLYRTLSAENGHCQVAATETVPFSATPAFSPIVGSSRIVISGNIVSFTLPAQEDGQRKCLNFIHDPTSNAYTVTPPANVHGFFAVGSVPNHHSVQCYTYFTASNAWVAESVGIANE